MSVNPNLTEAEAAVEYARLEDELEAARLEMKNGPEQYARHERASIAIAEFRQFWRGVGEMMDRGHPAHRSGLSIANHDGSAQ